VATRARGRVTNFWEALPVGLRRAAVGGVRRLSVANIKGEHSMHLAGAEVSVRLHGNPSVAAAAATASIANLCRGWGS